MQSSEKSEEHYDRLFNDKLMSRKCDRSVLVAIVHQAFRSYKYPDAFINSLTKFILHAPKIYCVQGIMLLHEFVSHVHAEKTKNPHSPVIGYFPLLERNLQGYFQRVNTLDSKDKIMAMKAYLKWKKYKMFPMAILSPIDKVFCTEETIAEETGNPAAEPPSTLVAAAAAPSSTAPAQPALLQASHMELLQQFIGKNLSVFEANANTEDKAMLWNKHTPSTATTTATATINTQPNYMQNTNSYVDIAGGSTLNATTTADYHALIASLQAGLLPSNSSSSSVLNLQQHSQIINDSNKSSLPVPSRSGWLDDNRHSIYGGNSNVGSIAPREPLQETRSVSSVEPTGSNAVLNASIRPLLPEEIVGVTWPLRENEDPSVKPNQVKILSRTIYIGGVTADISEEMLYSRILRIAPVQVIRINRTGNNAFVKFETRRGAVRAKDELSLNPTLEVNIKPIKIGWGCGFGPKNCFDYKNGESVVELNRFTELDKVWLLNSRHGGYTPGKKFLVGGVSISEPDYEPGLGLGLGPSSGQKGTDGILEQPPVAISTTPAAVPDLQVNPSVRAAQQFLNRLTTETSAAAAAASSSTTATTTVNYAPINGSGYYSPPKTLVIRNLTKQREKPFEDESMLKRRRFHAGGGGKNWEEHHDSSSNNRGSNFANNLSNASFPGTTTTTTTKLPPPPPSTHFQMRTHSGLGGKGGEEVDEFGRIKREAQ